jgi:hypothetical protein
MAEDALSGALHSALEVFGSDKIPVALPVGMTECHDRWLPETILTSKHLIDVLTEMSGRTLPRG